VPRNDLPRSERLRRAHHPPRVAIPDWIVGRAKGSWEFLALKPVSWKKMGKFVLLSALM
jgi:hypothetical protein